MSLQQWYDAKCIQYQNMEFTETIAVVAIFHYFLATDSSVQHERYFIVLGVALIHRHLDLIIVYMVPMCSTKFDI